MGILNLGSLESALAQPRMTFAGSELYPSIADKASALGYSLIQNHLFVDGNKRTGHAATVFLTNISARCHENMCERLKITFTTSKNLHSPFVTILPDASMALSQTTG